MPTSKPFSLTGRVVDSESPDVDRAILGSCLYGSRDGPAEEDVWLDMLIVFEISQLARLDKYTHQQALRHGLA